VLCQSPDKVFLAGLEREDDSTKRAKLEKTHVAGKRSSLDSEDITSNKKAKTEPKVVPKKSKVVVSSY